MSLEDNLEKINKNNKKELGQYYTTNYNYILQDLVIDKKFNKIIEPFCGNGDLLNFINDKNDIIIECYDIDPKKNYIIKKDILLEDDICFNNKFILTNPPYLNKNKTKNHKQTFDKYNQNDLYKCFLSKIIKNKCLGGIIIIPLNFFCSITKKDIKLRREFLSSYNIIRLNIFEDKVFNDTSYTICSFQFELSNNNVNNFIINTKFIPSNVILNLEFNNENDYIFGGEIYKLKQNDKIIIERITKLNKNKINNKYNIIFKCIDDNKKICAFYSNNPFIDDTKKLSARSFLSIMSNIYLNENQQLNIINKFNITIDNYRKKYNSLFLTNYREFNRKRISFNLIFIIINNLINEELINNF